jgi:hypothetical protein
MKKVMDWISSNKKNFTLFCGAVLGVGLLVGVLTIAFFTEKDKVTNEYKAQNIDIKLLEPTWNKTGMAKAQAVEPGMTIEKDPYVYNNSNDKVYVRMQIQVNIPSKNVKITPDNLGDYEEFYYTILSGIYWKNTSTKKDVLLLQSSNKSVLQAYKDSKASGIAFDLNKSKSQNTSFYYKDGWFYYVTNSAASVTNMKAKALELVTNKTASSKITKNLFDYIQVPELKSEYCGVYDSDFQIVVVAQAISATSYPDTGISSAVENFNKVYPTTVTDADTTD